MITAVHLLIYSDDPEATRSFLRDVLGWMMLNVPGADDIMLYEPRRTIALSL